MHDNVAMQGGYRVTYNLEHSFSFEEMINASKEGPIVIRLITNDIAVERPNKGQFVKVHHMEIMAEKAEGVGIVEDRFKSGQQTFFRIFEHSVFAVNVPIEVYNTLGQLIGSGIEITVPYSGIYFIRTNQGKAEKVFIR